MANRAGSQRWLQRQWTDPYVKRAQQEGFRSRAVYKLLEIHEKDNIFRSGMRLIDLGAAPGAWSQLARRLVGQDGQIIALDRLPMAPIVGVSFIQGDLHENNTLQTLLHILQPDPVDLVISDMAPNLSGMVTVDQLRGLSLAEQALELAQQVLKPKGDFLVKIFQGVGFEAYVKWLRSLFSRVSIRKPKASRTSSAEMYLVAKSFLGHKASSIPYVI